MKRNLVFILADQLRLQSCGYAGAVRAHTPMIDTFARDGMSFRNAVASAPVCGPYRASLMTGKYPSTTGMVINEMRMNPNHDCLGHALTRSGYETAYIGKWHLWSNETENQDSFANGFVPPGPARLGFDDFWAAYNFNFDYFRTGYFLGDGTRLIADRYETDFAAGMALDWLSTRRSREPFALFLSLSPPHDPWQWGNVPERFAARFDPQDFPLPANYADGSARYWEPQMDETWWLAEVRPNLPKWQAVYAAMVSAVDDGCRQLVDGLKTLDVFDDTMIVFTADHGEMFGAHGRIAKNIFYEESVRVPFLIYGPRHIPAGRTSDECLGTPDIMPTLLGALGIDPPEGVEGVDLSPHIFGNPGPVKDHALLQGMGHTWLWMDGFEWRGVRTKQFTYAIERAGGRELLFDNLADPLQMNNLASSGDHAGAKTALRTWLEQAMADLGDTFQPCSWYGEHWVENRIVQRGAKG